MFNLDPGKILIVLTVALIVLGPDKLPAAMKQVGKYWNEFQRVRSRLQSEMSGAISTFTDAVGPLSGAMDLGLSQIKGPLGVAASTFLGTNSLGPEPSLQPTAAADSPAPEPVVTSDLSRQFRVGDYMEPWSAVDGVSHPVLEADPYLN